MLRGRYRVVLRSHYGVVLVICLGSPSPAWAGARGGGDEGGKSTGRRWDLSGAIQSSTWLGR